ncbi:hypothetical protein HPO96_36255 [Kribbella sandramycini]|uniref:Uncharacterized protein n=1 Tax=Kribbella sandramycini TaxID=60450 RepID=A0A7Y4P3B7_9ACTN|nr:hypothetical protein [Kribbella sandramycini]MBB6570164.1 hypothetical protein [Kribbella sandramycini]NOL45711.1 hypothetical protein [Kribbella sandramycini]
MNLTTPPPVEQLDPEYAADLKQELVRKARRQEQPRSHRRVLFTWVPIVAAVTAVAISTASVVGLSQSRGGPAGPAGIVQLPADQSPQQTLENGLAFPPEIDTAARECLTPKKNAYGYPNHLGNPEAAKTIRSARWIKIPGDLPRLHLTLVTRPANVWYQCLDGEFLRDGVVLEDRTWYNEPVRGTWAWSTVDGEARASYSFRTDPAVTRVELRIRGTEGASPWFWVNVEDSSGYVAAALPGAEAQHGRSEVDVRALDENGKQVWAKTFG